MNEHSKTLLASVDTFRGQPILVVGDLIVDHYVWGKVSRISPEAPVLVVNVNEESRRPGGAANVAHNLVTLGAEVHLCGIVGDDEQGAELVRSLEQLGINTSGILVDRSRPTTVKSRVIAHSQQVVRVDREETRNLDAALTQELIATVGKKLESVRGAIISDYAKGVIGAELFELLESRQQKHSIGLSSVPVLVDPKGPNYSLYHHATVVKPNRSEASEASGINIRSREDAFEAGKKLLEKWKSELVLITLGEQGMALVSSAGGTISTFGVNTVAREVFDVSGAGDTVSAAFILALAAKAPSEIAAEIANFAAGIVVREVGTVAVTVQELRYAIAAGGN